jgi:hypothetical protein
VPKRKRPRLRVKAAQAVRKLEITDAAGAELHPVDRLKVLKTEINELTREANEIREMILRGEIGSVGAQFRARIEKRTHYDTRAMLAHFGEAMIPFERQADYLFLDYIRESDAAEEGIG